MNEKLPSDRFITRSHRLVDLICYLLIFVTAFRRVNELEGAFVTGAALALVGLFTLLYASEARLSRRFPAGSSCLRHSVGQSNRISAPSPGRRNCGFSPQAASACLWMTS